MMSKKYRKLQEAIRAKNPDKFEDALDMCFSIENDDGLCELLIEALQGDWHFRHEDVALEIQSLRCKGAVPALEERAKNNPEYLSWDENYALARKCTWALADIGTADAKHALERLSNSDVSVIRDFAQKRLDQWSLEIDRKSK